MQVTWRGHRGRGEVDLRQPPCGLHIVLTLVEGAFGAAALQDVLALFCRSVEFLGSHHTCLCHPQLLVEDRLSLWEQRRPSLPCGVHCLLLLLAQPLEVHGHHVNVGRHSEVAVSASKSVSEHWLLTASTPSATTRSISAGKNMGAMWRR